MALIVGATVAAVLSLATFAGASWAEAPDPVRVGDATLVKPGSSQTIDHGNAATPFTVALPATSTCPGDSAHDQWRVQSFLIPGNEDPATLRYGPIGPDPTGNGHYALFDIATAPFVHVLLRRNAAAAQPGVMEGFPAFDLTVVQGEKIPSGSYRVGIACTYFGRTAKYWDQQIMLDDSSGSLSWRLASAPSRVAGGETSGSHRSLFIVGAVGALLLGWIVWRRVASRPLVPFKEHS